MEADGRTLIRELVSKYYRNAYSMLEVGSGGGELLIDLAATYGGEVWGIDPYIPRRYFRGVSFADIPAEEIHTLGRNFDLIFSVYSLHHFRDMRTFLQGMKEVLRPEGTFIFVDWRKGTETGVPEPYLSLSEVVTQVEKAGYVIVESGAGSSHFYLVGKLG
jgi:ubiquinone/menaquinone biosynthesis C-methylase UbiE